MSDPKLTADQFRALKGLSLWQKLEKLKQWLKEGSIREEQLRFFSNHWIKKAHKASEPQGIKHRYKTVLENDVRNLINRLQHNIKRYVTYRNKNDVMLKAETLSKIEGMLESYHAFPVLDEFLIIAMRYPDKRLNELAVGYVKKWRMESLPFWANLWADENLVPMDAVRLMMPEPGKIADCFNKEAISYLLPLIERQKDKEIQRLEWAVAAEFSETATHRNRRLESFNALIAAAKKFVE